MEEKTGYFEESPNNKSFGRLNIAWYFWGICLPGSLWILYVVGYSILKSTITVSNGLSLLGFFIILQLGWIAPKQLSKLNEVNKFLGQLKNK